MDQLKQSLLEAPIIEKNGYHYFVHPISDGLPKLEPGLLREIVIRIIRKAELEDVDRIGEVIDASVMDRAALRHFLARQVQDAASQGLLFS